MGCGVSWVDEWLTRTFFRVGLFVGRHPGYFIIVPVLLTALCMTGYQRVRYEMDPEYLFCPINGEAKAERAVVEKYFKTNYSSRFNVGRITRPGRFGRVIAIPRHGNDMLKREIWEELRMLDNIVRNATVKWDGDGGDFQYEQVCARWQDNCFTNDILNLDQVIDEVENRSLLLTFPIMFNPVTWDAHAFPVYFGGSEVDGEGLITRVPSVQLVYFAKADTKAQDVKGAAWEDRFLEVVGEADADLFQHISVARFASRTLDVELERNTRSIVPFFSSTFAIMAIFSVLTCMMTDWVRSKPWLGLLGNLSAGMATLAAFGLAMYLDFEFIGINLAAPFLMIGIGIDDTFVMLAAWRRTPVTMSVPERMAHTLSDAAVSITITSVTDIVSFLIGIISPFQSVRIFCIYSGLAVCFTFVWHLTFFSACMSLSGYREQYNRHALTGCKVVPRSLAKKKNILYRAFCAGGHNPEDPNNPVDNKEHAGMSFFRDTMAGWLNRWPVKVLVLLVFAAYLAGACYGITTMKEGLQRRKLSHATSYSIEFYDREDFYFREFPFRIQVVVEGEYNYSDPVIQQQMENLTQTLENSTYISSPLYTESWLRSFLGYVTRNQDYLNATIDNEADFIAALKELWLFPANPFSLDVKFDETGSRIIASRFLIQAVNVTDTNQEKDMVLKLRKICAESPLNASVFHPYFVFFDQFMLVRPTTIQCMIIGAIIMMVISFIFIPNVLCSLWVAFSIISIEVGVAGYMCLWDIHLDSISMINLIMCIGFSVDFTAHICYAYMSSKAATSEERVRECLHSLGLPIFQGAASTILGIIALVLADSYIFLVFFKMVFMVIFFGAMHGLFLLPVLLSIFGPGACSRKADPEDKDHKSPVEKTFPHPYCIPHPSLHMTQLQAPSKGSGHAPAFGIPLPGLPSLLEKDMGLGTSGEDSSEASSSKSQRRRAEEDERQRRKYVEGWRKTSAAPTSPAVQASPAAAAAAPLQSTHMRHYQPRHMDVYNNSGYLSDEDRHVRSRRESRDSRGYRGSPSANHHPGGGYPMHPAGQHRQPHRPPAQFSPGAPTNFRYMGEMKFP